MKLKNYKTSRKKNDYKIFSKNPKDNEDFCIKKHSGKNGILYNFFQRFWLVLAG